MTGRYSHLAKACARRACESFAAWSRHGFAAGFFLVCKPRWTLRVPSLALIPACIGTVPDTRQEAEDRLAFIESLPKETMVLQGRLANERRRLAVFGVAAAAAAWTALLSFAVALKTYGFDLAAGGILLSGLSVWLIWGLRARRREAELAARAGDTGNSSRFVPWTEGFAAPAGL